MSQGTPAAERLMRKVVENVGELPTAVYNPIYSALMERAEVDERSAMTLANAIIWIHDNTVNSMR